MADLIELVCECGKVLKVPRSRAGQTGRCAQCKRPVQIPLEIADEGKALGSTYTKLPPDTGQQWEELDKTTIRMSPFRESGSTSLNLPEDGYAEQAPVETENLSPEHGQGSFFEHGPGGTGGPAETQTPFLAQEPSYSEDNFFAQEQALSAPVSPSFQPPPQPFEPAPPPIKPAPQVHEPTRQSDVPWGGQEEGKQCPRCGDMNPAEMEQCQYCGASFYEEVVNSEVPPPIPTPAKKTPAPRLPAPVPTTHKSRVWLWSLIFFILGAVLGTAGGIFLVPGDRSIWSYLAETQDLDSLEPVNDSEELDGTGMENDESEPNADDDVEMTVEDTDSLEKYDARFAKDLERSISTIQIYLSALSTEHSKLKNKMAVLESKTGGVNLPDVEKASNDAGIYVKGLSQRINIVKRLTKQKNWDDLRKFYLEKIKKRHLHQLKPQGSRRIAKLREATKKVERLLLSLKSSSKTRASTKYMGRWYGKLKKQNIALKKLGKKNLSFTSNRANAKFERIQSVLIKSVERYPREVNEAVAKLEKAQKSKSLKKWISYRREKAVTLTQQKQADLLETFSKTKKFELNIRKELRDMKISVDKLVKDAKDSRITESKAAKVAELMEKIHRVYQEKIQEFASAVENFRYWKK